MRRMLSVAVAAAAATLILVPAGAGWTWAVEGPVLRPFSLAADEYEAGQHRGIDVGAAINEPVRAPVTGTVSFVGPVPAGGRALTIQTADGYAVTLLQLGSVDVARGSTVAEGAVVGQVGVSEDGTTAVPHVHLGIRVAAEPNGYVDPLLLLPARTPMVVPEPTTAVREPDPAPPAPAAESAGPAAPTGDLVPVAAASVPTGPLLEATAANAPNGPVSPATPSSSSAEPTTGRETRARPIVQPPSTTPTASTPVRLRAASGDARRPVTGPGAGRSPRSPRVAPNAETNVAPRPSPHARAYPAARAPHAGRRSPAAPSSIFDRFADAPTGQVVEHDDDPDNGAAAMPAIALALLLVGGAWMWRRSGGPRPPEDAEDARMMTRHERTPCSPEDSRRRGLAICERPPSHRARGGIRGPGGHLRPPPPPARGRRAHGQWDGRARHAGHGRRRSSGRLTT